MNQNNICCNRPYNDDYMVFDTLTGHYVLTERAIAERCAVDIRARLSDDKTVNADIVINKLCRTASDTIYSYIHSYSVHNKRQDCIIATVPNMRAVIQRAMEYQAEYILSNGDLFLSLENETQGKEIHKLSKEILLNSGILYCGV